jgi:hypothetical protein
MKTQEAKRPPPLYEEQLKALKKDFNSRSINSTNINSANHDSINLSWGDMPPLMKGIIVVGSGVLMLWASGYAFTALAHAIRGFKDLQRSLKEV